MERQSYIQLLMDHQLRLLQEDRARQQAHLSTYGSTDDALKDLSARIKEQLDLLQAEIDIKAAGVTQ